MSSACSTRFLLGYTVAHNSPLKGKWVSWVSLKSVLSDMSPLGTTWTLCAHLLLLYIGSSRPRLIGWLLRRPSWCPPGHVDEEEETKTHDMLKGFHLYLSAPPPPEELDIRWMREWKIREGTLESLHHLYCKGLQIFVLFPNDEMWIIFQSNKTANQIRGACQKMV